MLSLDKLNAAVAATGVDMTKAVAGGEYTPPEAGPGFATFVGYIEAGKVKRKIKGAEKIEDVAIMRFELTSAKWAPKEKDGVKIPHIIDLKFNRSMNEKANFFKLFQRMNHAGKATHMAQLLGTQYKVTVYHREAKIGDKVMVFAELGNKDARFSIMPSVKEITDDETGEVKIEAIKQFPYVSHLHALLWDNPDMDQWKSIFIDGKAEDQKDDQGNVTRVGKSRNKYQIMAASAVNYKGSKLEELLTGNGIALDLPDLSQDMEEEAAEEGAEEASTSKPAPKSAADTVSGDDALTDVS